MCQLEQLTQELRGVPAGHEAQGRVGTIRLIRKTALLEVPAIRSSLESIGDILAALELLAKTERGHEYVSMQGSAGDSVRRKLKRLHEAKHDIRKEVESVLKWDSPASDRFCQMFPLASPPQFTFVFHRWAFESGVGKPLGRDNELLALIMMAPCAYV